MSQSLLNTDQERYPSIGDYAIIGNGRCAALISKTGSIDWLCWHRFDSPSVFGALLDRNQGGCFQIEPIRDYTVKRQYIGHTNVLETTFTTDTGVLRITDAMAVTSEAEKRKNLQAEHELIRAVECVEGVVEVKICCDPRPNYGRAKPHLQKRSHFGFFYTYRSQVYLLRSDLPLQSVEKGTQVEGRVTLKPGKRHYFSFSFTQNEPAIIPPLGFEAQKRLEKSIEWWQQWADKCCYEGLYRDAVLRSALVLKLMVYAPSGAIIAAPTTSLPEQFGGDLNWDYRYCWLRDSAMTLRSLLDLGYTTEGEAYLSWLLHATQLTAPKLRVAYNVYGNPLPKENELTHLEGYGGAKPVRVGNVVYSQRQLDVYGEVAIAAYEYVCRGGKLDRVQARRLANLAKAICQEWRKPDAGIWEFRSIQCHHTESKAMCAIALDRLLQLHQQGHIKVSTKQLEQERNAIRSQIESCGYNETLQSYVRAFDGDIVDASLLRLALNNYIDPKHPRMRFTAACIQQQLGKNGLLYRYIQDAKGQPVHEGAFGICGFWEVSYLARINEVNAAKEKFEYLLSCRNDVGLLAEEIDPNTGAALGNFPQAFTHVGLIDAAMTLSECCGEMHRPSPDESKLDTSPKTPD
ncbi:MAG: glycoside hydrolase family 15 protein [Chroococcales cyanobacterium]